MKWEVSVLGVPLFVNSYRRYRTAGWGFAFFDEERFFVELFFPPLYKGPPGCFANCINLLSAMGLANDNVVYYHFSPTPPPRELLRSRVTVTSPGFPSSLPRQPEVRV